MCGIAGFTNYSCIDGNHIEVAEAMARAIASRGPDGSGTFCQPEIYMAHRRLSIIDIKGGSQPMSSADGRYTIVFNGEIYNFVELRQELAARGCVFTTESDTEVLLQCFARHGSGCLARLNGMFAFAIWDSSRKRLFLARDRIGVKPLVFSVVGSDIVFASEIKALLENPLVSRRVDLASLSKYLTYGYVPAPNSIFQGIRKLEPGMYAEFGRDGLCVSRYWDIPVLDNPISESTSDECSDRIACLLEDSVRKQLRSDVPVGVFLSGGIDSSAIAAMASRHVHGRLKTFSMGFEEPSYDETRYSQLVARVFGTEHYHETVTARQGLEVIPASIELMDEPFADASIVPTYMLSRMTASEVKVVLGGDGGDELFAGYASFGAHKLMEALSFLPRLWRDALVRLLRKIPASTEYASPGFLLRQFLKGAGVSAEVRFFLWMGAFGNHAKGMLLSGEAGRELLREDAFEDLRRLVRSSGIIGDFERLLYLCMKLYLQDDILVKVDRASMAHSLEARVPFLDHNLVEYVSRLDSGLKLKGMTGSKYIFKRAMDGILPKEIIRRRKSGFALPVSSWLRNDLRSMLMDLLDPAVIRQDGWLDADYVGRIMDDHISGRADYRKELWALMSLMIWRNKYL